jgi:hypothetical protein
MLNSIRPPALASLLEQGEAQKRMPPGKDQGDSVDRPGGQTVSARTGVQGVYGDRMVGRWRDMNQGSRAGQGTAFMAGRRPEEPYPAGDRASILAKKRGNARGAKGGREVEA